MNTYGKPVYQWHGFFKLIQEVREETGHLYDRLEVNDGLEEIYKTSRTRADFKARMKANMAGKFQPLISPRMVQSPAAKERWRKKEI